MRVSLCTIGSRGDVEPFLILGEHPANHRHSVTVCSANLYCDLAREFSLCYREFDGDYGLLTNRDELKQLIGGNPFHLGRVLRKQVYPVLESSLEGFYELALESDWVLYHPKRLLDSGAIPTVERFDQIANATL